MNLIDEETRCDLRAPDVVLCGSDMNGAWGTRHSFARTMLRRAAAHRWTVAKTRLDLDGQGRGTAVYTVNAEGFELTFIAFCQALEESERTDRVIANAWDVTAALVEGELTPQREAELRRNIPVQEQGRTDPETIIMTRANRSARFFDYVSDCLATGNQPDVAALGPSPYLIRSTAFYGNGKFGLKELDNFPSNHPLSVPYRSQMLTAWLLRELSMDLVEHVARAKAQAAGTVAVPLDAAWGKYFGLGNATGLGMVPFLVNHPGYLDAWCKLREIPLAAGLAACYSPDHPNLGRIAELLTRADRHLAEKSELKTMPFLSTESIRPQLRRLLSELQAFMTSEAKATPVLARLHEIATNLSPEARGLFASIVIELQTDFDEEAEALLTVTTPPAFDPAMSCHALGRLLDQNYAWTHNYDFATPERASYYWYSSADSEEPRRALRAAMAAGTVEHCTDVARRVNALTTDLELFPDKSSVAEFLLAHPEHRFAAERIQQTRDYYYRDLQDNLLDADFLPLSTQRFQLATYGMNNFSPQSTDWVRVTLFSGAPRVADILNGTDDDDWLFPLAPEGEN
ncbi:hypothetical protein AL755_13720 [Arthrobacter sp. ERGS1:01]|uniref:hypothetical protein n=1 Tax=Arthrobacter sp. ERGS1:01 TaxID=1704044 RepID=UPI0006B4C93F|nr:hypothetical protein [Arthrobacter sp. ERGS1:01]ALE06272.1 hypothetical protein AL755_13720 [Arthrobacter sp. ERGS1:01]